MTPERWRQITDVFHAARGRNGPARGQFLDAACADDRSMRAEVEALLSAHEKAGRFGAQPFLPGEGPPGLESDVRPDPLAQKSLSHYQNLETIGKGGMGVVYRARDTRLGRDVAIKVLPADRMADQTRRRRFVQEARTASALNHPNIVTIHEIDSVEGIDFMVMEYIRGRGLDTLIPRHGMPLGEALRVAIPIADALARAHAAGIVHRDVKPSNVMVGPDGIVKVLDFGLAKLVGPEPANDPDETGSTATEHGEPLSDAGTIAGTAGYMSPEQATGRKVDSRSDVFAFGALLYEMATGRRAFAGDSAADTIAKVVKEQPKAPREVAPDLPRDLDKLILRCLKKEPERRFQHMLDVKLELEQIKEDSDSAADVAPTTPGKRNPRLLAAVLASVAAVTVAGWLAWRAREPTPSPRQVRRLLIGLPEEGPLARAASMPLGTGQASLAISPDGTRVAYVMERQGVTQLYLHALEELEAVPIAHTEGAFGPFFSPDGRWVGFFARNKLKKVAISGGRPIDLCAAPNPFGGSWGTDGTILFAADEGRRPTTIRDTGSEPRVVPVKDDRGSLTQPHLLPGGKAAIVSHASDVGVLSLDTGEYRRLVENGGDGRYAPTGHLVFSREGALLAAPFDLERLAVSGPAAVILEGVRMDGQRAVAQAVFSRDGTLIYVPGSAANDATRPVWVDRQGKVQPLGMPPRRYRSFRLSPDGRRLAIVIGDPNNDVWVQDLERGALTRLTSGGNNVLPTWTPDGKRVVFTERTGGGATPFWVPADGSGEPEQMFKGEEPSAVWSFSPAGDLVAIQRRAPDTGPDLWVRPLREPHTPQPFLRTRFTEVGAQFSPGGRWISYVSDESGQYEVYVRPYPGPGGKWQVSTHGGEENIWSRDGKELFYRNGHRWMVVAVGLEPEFKAGPPQLLFEGPYVNVGGLSYDVTPDGRRFLLLEPAEQSPITHLKVVLDWFEEVKQKTGPRPR